MNQGSSDPVSRNAVPARVDMNRNIGRSGQTPALPFFILII